jgi:hypothetical protein
VPTAGKSRGDAVRLVDAWHSLVVRARPSRRAPLHSRAERLLFRDLRRVGHILRKPHNTRTVAQHEHHS